MTEPTPEEIQAGQDLTEWMKVYEVTNGRLPDTMFRPDGAFHLGLKPGNPGYLVIRRVETRRQRFVRWALRRKPPVEVYPVKVREVGPGPDQDDPLD